MDVSSDAPAHAPGGEVQAGEGDGIGETGTTAAGDGSVVKLPALGDTVESTDTRPVNVRGVGAFVSILSRGQMGGRADGTPTYGSALIQRFDISCSSKMVALTFDDGPDPQFTPRILDVLKQYQAHATFFVIGELANKSPDIIKRMVAEGNEVANHGYSHRTSRTSTMVEYANEIQNTERAIQAISGARTRWFRPNNMSISPAMLMASEATHHTIVLWTIDARDWAAGSSSEVAQAAVPRDIKRGSVILLHDGGGNRQMTVSAVRRILDELKARGFVSVTLSRLVHDAQSVPGASR
jgi:peptidoglycan/xylan/chitin deacetylase (PgdA/CDA1 family)